MKKIGYALLLAAACGGSPFEISADDAGSRVVDATAAEASVDSATEASIDGTVSNDAGNSDSGIALDSSVLDSGERLDAGIDVIEVDSCATRPSVTNSSCAGQEITYPSNFCLFLITDAVSTGEYMTEITPAACASWCTFTCACLIEAGTCGTGAPACMFYSTSFILECDDR
jgi:hypothetical protein